MTGRHVGNLVGARRRARSPQVALKWQVQQGIPVIPKSADPTHLAENADLFSWVRAMFFLKYFELTG
jgi:diketogulonate reductase-like aldo/keto reductase